MRVIKKIIIEVFEDFSTNVIEEINIEESQTNETYEDFVTSVSWKKYNLVYLGKGSKILNLLSDLDEKIKVEFYGEIFEGKLDIAGSRIFGLSNLYKYAKVNNIELGEHTKVRIIFDEENKRLKMIVR